MFNSIGAYFLFVIPMTLAIVLGLIFESKLVDFEEKISELIKNVINNITSKFFKSKAKTNCKPSKKVRHHEIRPLEMSA